jgi:hypothetical protein
VTGAIDTYNGANNVVISNNTIRRYSYAGIKAQAVNRATITGNVMSDGYSDATDAVPYVCYGIVVEEKPRSGNTTLDKYDVVISNNVINYASYVGIYAKSDNMVISDNIVRDVAKGTIALGLGILSVGTNVHISDNLLFEIEQRAIQVGADSNQVSVTNNHWDNTTFSGATGVYLDDCNNVTVTGNYLKGNAGSAIRTIGPVATVDVSGNTCIGTAYGLDLRETGGTNSGIRVGKNNFKSISTGPIYNLTTSGVSYSGDVFDVVALGAAGDGVTDDTAAIQAAIDAAEAAGGGTVFLPVGTYHLDDPLVFDAVYAYGTTTAGSVRLLGDSSVGTVLQRDPADPNEFCIEITGGSGWEHALYVFDNLMFYGGPNRETGGIYAHAAVQLGLHVRNCSFWRCDVGFKNIGPINWRLEACSFDRGNIGIYLQPAPTMHGGCGLVDGRSNISYSSQAGVYIDGTNTAAMEQVNFRDIVIEANPGFGVFVKEWNGQWPLRFESVYFEGNGTGATAVVEGVTYDDMGNFRIADSDNVVFADSKLTNGLATDGISQVIDSHVVFDSCYRNATYADVNFVGDSEVLHAGAYLYGTHVFDGNEVMLGGFRASPSLSAANKPTARTPITPFVMDYKAVNLWPDGSMQTAFVPTNANGNSYSFVSGDAPEWGGYMSVTIPQCAAYSNGMRLWDNFTEVADAIYVWSFDVRATADANLAVLSSGGNGNLINCTSPKGGVRCVPGEWRRYYGMGRSAYTQSSGDLYIYNTDDVTATYHLANFQLVKVATYNDAVRYIREGRYPGMMGIEPLGLSVKNGSTSAGYIDIYEDSDDGTSKIRLIGPALASDVTLTLPVDDGTAGQVLSTDGSGVLSWSAAVGFTNLTDFDTQTAWRMFYSDGSGDTTELALGANGTFLESNGATAAPAYRALLAADIPGTVDDAITSAMIGDSQAIRLLASDTATMNGTAKDTIYTVPAGKSAIVTMVIIRNPSWSLVGGTDFDLGDGASADTWRTAVDLSTLTASSDCIILQPPTTKFTVFDAGDTFGIKPVTGSTDPATTTIMVYGIEF